MKSLKDIITEKIESYEDWKNDILNDAQNAQNIDSGRINRWYQQLNHLDIKIQELKTILFEYENQDSLYKK